MKNANVYIRAIAILAIIFFLSAIISGIMPASAMIPLGGMSSIIFLFRIMLFTI